MNLKSIESTFVKNAKDLNPNVRIIARFAKNAS